MAPTRREGARSRCFLVALGVVGLVAAGCGGGGGESPRASQTSTSIDWCGPARLSPERSCTGARLDGADLAGRDLHGVGLNDASLQRADLAGANLTGAKLRGANLTDANLRGANLTNVALDDATLAGADLGGATLTGSYLAGVDFRDTRLDDVTFEAPPHLVGARNLGDERVAAMFDTSIADLARVLGEREVTLEENVAVSLAPACAGTPVPGAGSAVAAAPFRPITEVEPNLLPSAWRPAALRFAALVLCLDGSFDTKIGECSYDAGHGKTETISAFAQRLRARIVEPSTARVLADRTFEASHDFGGCPTFLVRGPSAVDPAALLNSKVGPGPLVEFARPFVERAAG